jgi:ribosome-associated protein
MKDNLNGCRRVICSTLSAGECKRSLPRRSKILNPEKLDPPAEEMATNPTPLNSKPVTADTSNWRLAVERADSRKAFQIKVLDLRDVTTFTDYFVICSVSNPRQGQAVCDEIEKGLKEIGDPPVSIEGYDKAEWILMDFGDFLVHIFLESARSFYDLERLWRHAKMIEPSAV